MTRRVETIEKSDWRDDYTWPTHEVAALPMVRLLFKTVAYPLVRTTWEGFGHVPTSGPCIIASNHVNNLDVLLMGMYLPRHPFFMAKVELYKNPMVGWLIRQAGAFPVFRGEKDSWAMTQAGRLLAAGQMLYMFPEGTRSKTGILGRGKSGAVKLALEYQVPVIPAAIFGTHDLRLGWKATKVHIRVGPPLDIVSLAGPPPHSPETLRNLTTLLMRQIAAMLPPDYRGVYSKMG